MAGHQAMFLPYHVLYASMKFVYFDVSICVPTDRIPFLLCLSVCLSNDLFCLPSQYVHVLLCFSECQAVYWLVCMPVFFSKCDSIS